MCGKEILHEVVKIDFLGSKFRAAYHDDDIVNMYFDTKYMQFGVLRPKFRRPCGLKLLSVGCR